MHAVGIGILGFGTVGAGVVEGLLHNGALLSQRLGVEPVLKGVADLDIETDRGIRVPGGLLTTDAHALIARDDVDVIVELIGGTGIAKTFVEEALRAGKPVVTANKKLLAEYGESLYALSREKGADLYFGASVGGGIPVIRALREGLVGNRIVAMQGILNGTCNYILTRMEKEGLPFDTVLQDAQYHGFAEADPSLDIDGFDTAHKAVILASLAYGNAFDLSDVYVEGIRALTREDVVQSAALGYRIKLLAVIRRDDGQVEIRVAPTLVPQSSLLAAVNGVYNAVMVESDLADRTMYYGQGAGRLPTASTVLADIADAVRNLAMDASLRISPIPSTGETLAVKDITQSCCRYYLRISVEDHPGVLAKITGVLAKSDISIESFLQKRSDTQGYADLVILTHEALESEMNQALDTINALEVVKEPAVRLRVASE
jgi:homoserine dehydrogenase